MQLEFSPPPNLRLRPDEAPAAHHSIETADPSFDGEGLRSEGPIPPAGSARSSRRVLNPVRASSGAVAGRLSYRAVAWTVAIGQVVLLAQASALWAWSGQVFAAEFAIPSSAALALVGALVASKRPDNHLGWFLLLLPVPGLIAFLGTEYFEVA